MAQKRSDPKMEIDNVEKMKDHAHVILPDKKVL
jgi:hypothetical protein